MMAVPSIVVMSPHPSWVDAMWVGREKGGGVEKYQEIPEEDILYSRAST